MEYLWVLIPVLAGTIISLLLLTRRFDTCEKVDKGMELCYWKLSYRRKFIRTLWMFPIAIVLTIYFHITFQSYIQTCIIGVMFGMLFLIQAVYNYRKWKSEE